MSCNAIETEPQIPTKNTRCPGRLGGLELIPTQTRQTTLAAPSPHDDFANAARARLLLKRKREGEAGEAPEKPSHLKKTTLSFAGSADDDF